MTKLLSSLVAIFILLSTEAQYTSIHHQELDHYNSENKTTEWYEQNVNNEIYGIANKEANCNLNKMVYGWHPYWNGSAHNNYDWDLLSHLSFFSYEVDYITGAANTTHGWETSEAVDSALANGVKVILTVSLFGNSEVSSFLTNPTAQQNLIDSLINTILDRGAHGVTIDFEFIPSSQETNYANFMNALGNQMHIAIPGSEVSAVVPNIDWNGSYDLSAFDSAIDYHIIMGYGYYWSGSSTAGPTDPLYLFDSDNYSLSKSITEYLHWGGVPKNKLVLGLPYYGREWPTQDLNIPSTTTGAGSAVTIADVKDNVSGDYIPANYIWEADSYTDIYAFNDGQNKQCFISLEDAFGKRLEHVNNTGIAGIGIWAVGYDDGYSEMWDVINNYLTDCYVDSCSGEIHDFGGPTRDYYNYEDYTWTLSPPNSFSIDVDFTMFDVEANADTLFIYDGSSTTSPLIGSFTGTNSPGSFTTATGAVTFRFKSNETNVAPGWLANYTCNEYQTDMGSSPNAVYTIYPNPFNSGFFIVGNLSGLNSLKLFDLSGKEIDIEFNNSSGQVRLIENYATGVYLLEIINDAGTRMFKLVKE